eukprot:m.241692 g.241692  ORF g.241692 m.241692 type:complete len:866 (+) comp25442_c0_seq1:88-2685(+)
MSNDDNANDGDRLHHFNVQNTTDTTIPLNGMTLPREQLDRDVVKVSNLVLGRTKKNKKWSITEMVNAHQQKLEEGMRSPPSSLSPQRSRVLTGNRAQQPKSARRRSLPPNASSVPLTSSSLSPHRRKSNINNNSVCRSDLSSVSTLLEDEYIELKKNLLTQNTAGPNATSQPLSPVDKLLQRTKQTGTSLQRTSSLPSIDQHTRVLGSKKTTPISSTASSRRSSACSSPLPPILHKKRGSLPTGVGLLVEGNQSSLVTSSLRASPISKRRSSLLHESRRRTYSVSEQNAERPIISNHKNRFVSCANMKPLHGRNRLVKPIVKKHPLARVFRTFTRKHSNAKIVRVGGGYVVICSDWEKYFSNQELEQSLRDDEHVPKGVNVVERNKDGTMALATGVVVEEEPEGFHVESEVDDSSSEYSGTENVADMHEIANNNGNNMNGVVGSDNVDDSVLLDTHIKSGEYAHVEKKDHDIDEENEHERHDLCPLSRDGEGQKEVSDGEGKEEVSDGEGKGEDNDGNSDGEDLLTPQKQNQASGDNDGNDKEGDDAINKGQSLPRKPLTTWEMDHEVTTCGEDGAKGLKDGTIVHSDGAITMSDGTTIPQDDAYNLAMRRKHKKWPEDIDEKRRRKKMSLPKWEDTADGPVEPFRTPESLFEEMIALTPDEEEDQSITSALDYLSRYCIISNTQAKKYMKVFECLDRDGDGVISLVELDFGLKTINKEFISSQEIAYVTTVLDVDQEHKKSNGITARQFALISALSERVVGLDTFVKNLVNTLDLNALKKKVGGCKDLFYILDENKRGVVSSEDMSNELVAGRLSKEHEDLVLEKLCEGGRDGILFLDFLKYLPLFVEIHNTINNNPFETARDQ